MRGSRDQGRSLAPGGLPGPAPARMTDTPSPDPVNYTMSEPRMCRRPSNCDESGNGGAPAQVRLSDPLPVLARGCIPGLRRARTGGAQSIGTWPPERSKPIRLARGRPGGRGIGHCMVAPVASRPASRPCRSSHARAGAPRNCPGRRGRPRPVRTYVSSLEPSSDLRSSSSSKACTTIVIFTTTSWVHSTQAQFGPKKCALLRSRYDSADLEKLRLSVPCYVTGVPRYSAPLSGYAAR